jgi:hypothetical protein
LNQRKLIRTFAGLVVLAGISYHQVRDPGPNPRDTAIMIGTLVSDRSERLAEEKEPVCGPGADGRDDVSGSRADCSTPPR